RWIRFRCDFALAHTSKKCQVDCLLLGGWKPTDYLVYQVARVTKHDFFFGGIMDPCIRLLFGFILQAFFRARISLLFPQPVDRPTPGQCYHPAEWFALLRREVFRLIPNLHENLL